MCVSIIDMDTEENVNPLQELEDTERIEPLIVPLSSLDTFIKGSIKLKNIN